MFHEALDKYRDLNALGFKRQGVWEHISYSQYYLLARRTAKGFLKVRAPPQTCPPALGPRRPAPRPPPDKPLEVIPVEPPTLFAWVRWAGPRSEGFTFTEPSSPAGGSALIFRWCSRSDERGRLVCWAGRARGAL